MAQAQTKKPKQPRTNERITRAQKEISALLEREGVSLTIDRIQIFTKEADRLLPAGELTPAAIASLAGFPAGTILFPRVEIKLKAGANGQKAD
jgi:hypothetical protein